MSDSGDEDNVDSGSNPTPDDWQHITKPGPHDVLCGRGGGTNNHPGNVKFRQTINEYKLKYLGASKVEKPKVAREVVKVWRSLDPPGRFLARKDESRRGPGSVKAEGNVWHDVGDKKAREKASQCLRERTPDVLPYVREMQRRQDLLTGQGLRLVEQQMRMQNEGRGMNGPMNGMNGMPVMNGMNGGYSAVGGHPCAHSGAPGNAMTDPDINNAFSVEHFFTHGFQNTGNQSQFANPDDPLSLQQMSQDPHRWDQAGFQNAMPPPAQVYSTSGPEADLINPMPLQAAQDAFAVPDAVSSGIQPMPLNGTGDDELTLEEYMESMKEFGKAYHLDSELAQQPRTNQLLGMQGNSWVRSFHSVEEKTQASMNDDSNGSADRGQNGGATKARKKQANRLDAALSRQSGDKLSKQQSTRTHLSNATHKSAMSTMSTKSAQSNMSGISMFSELSEQSRNSKMDQARGMASSLSMMSDFTELTDLSETLNNLDLATGAASTTS